MDAESDPPPDGWSAIPGRSMYYDRQGTPIDMYTWGALFQEPGYKLVDATDLPDGVRVSTVWLGINHQWFNGPPLIFETMIFGGPLDSVRDQYTTEEQARDGHRHWVTVANTAADVDLPAWDDVTADPDD